MLYCILEKEFVRVIMEIKEYRNYKAEEIHQLYTEVGWTAYTENMSVLEQGYKNSLLVLAAYENDELLGIIRVVGDGFTIIFVQDILVFPREQRKGVGTALMKAVLDRYPDVRQIELATDNNLPRAVARDREPHPLARLLRVFPRRMGGAEPGGLRLLRGSDAVRLDAGMDAVQQQP